MGRERGAESEVWQRAGGAAGPGPVPGAAGEAEAAGPRHEHHPAERGGEAGERAHGPQEADTLPRHGQGSEVGHGQGQGQLEHTHTKC